MGVPPSCSAVTSEAHAEIHFDSGNPDSLGFVHVDWHLARSHQHRMSMEWHQHWIVGLAAFFFLVLFSAWKWPEQFVWAAMVNGAIGLFLGHIVEAWLESLHGHEAFYISAERWRVFFEFPVAGLVGFVLGMVVVFGRRRLSPS